jgi:hypothetical protein
MACRGISSKPLDSSRIHALSDTGYRVRPRRCPAVGGNAYCRLRASLKDADGAGARPGSGPPAGVLSITAVPGGSAVRLCGKDG